MPQIRLAWIPALAGMTLGPVQQACTLMTHEDPATIGHLASWRSLI